MCDQWYWWLVDYYNKLSKFQILVCRPVCCETREPCCKSLVVAALNGNNRNHWRIAIREQRYVKLANWKHQERMTHLIIHVVWILSSLNSFLLMDLPDIETKKIVLSTLRGLHFLCVFKVVCIYIVYSFRNLHYIFHKTLIFCRNDVYRF